MICPFIYQYEWKDRNFPSHAKDWKKFETSKSKERDKQAYISKYNSECLKQTVLLLITNGEKRRNFFMKILSGLFRDITSDHHGDYYCINCLIFIQDRKQT